MMSNENTSATGAEFEWVKPTDALNRHFELPEADPAVHAVAAAPGASGASLKRVFRIGKVKLLFTATLKCEYSDTLAAYPVPNTPDWFAGLANFRGNLVPVFDLHHVLAQQREDSRKQHTLVIGEDEEAAAIIIDGLPAQRLFTPSQRVTQLPALGAPLNKGIIGGYQEDSELLIEIDYVKLIGSIVESARP